MKTNQLQILRKEEDWQDFLHQSQTCQGAVLFKFSPTCPISHRAEKHAMRWMGFLSEDGGLCVACLDVIASRVLSLQIAGELALQHQSPQVIFLSPTGEVLWHASHGAISLESLTAHITLPDSQLAKTD